MVADPSRPLHPRLGPLWIAVLALAVGSLLAWRLRPAGEASVPPPQRISARGRIVELQQAVSSLATPMVRSFTSGLPLSPPATNLAPAWDNALFAVLAAEKDDMDAARRWLASTPSGAAGEAFRRCFSAAYLATPDPPSPADRATAREALRSGFAARLLEARLDPAHAERIRSEATAWALPRVATLAAAGLTLLLLVPSGLIVGAVLTLSRKDWQPDLLPVIHLSGQDLALLLLGWLLAFLLSGLLIAPALSSLPFLRPFLVPLTYGFHAAFGLVLLSRLEGVPLAQSWRRWTRPPQWRGLAWGLAFLALAGTLVLGVTLLLGPLLEHQEAPQQQLMDLVAETQGTLPLLSLLFTVAVVAPIFEECLFRGVLLPWLGHRWRGAFGPRLGWALALAVSSLAFGLIHLQPVALPVLSTLGLALGLAFLRTGNLLSAVFVHGLWNGGVFLFYRLVLG